MVYHSGELEVQQQAGVQAQAKDLGGMIKSNIPSVAHKFLSSQQLAIASTIDANGRVWASLLTGKPEFIQVIEEQLVRIDAAQIVGDPLSKNLQLRDEIGILVIDLATRRRLRLNGKAQLQPDQSIDVQIEQVYFNCPKYIQLRRLIIDSQESCNPELQNNNTLTQLQQNWIAASDTFFIASYHPESGADASHRGGNPGFVKVLDAKTLIFPDYSGNNMFNTLGNLTVNPLSGLLFIDFEVGSTLQVTGKASIIWDAQRVAEFTGAERLVEFEIEQVNVLMSPSPLHWQFLEYSPFNPH